MEVIYPLNPVVTDNAAFAQKYNEDFMSAYYLSQCITINEAKDLISRKASFSRVVFLDEESALVEAFKNECRKSATTPPEMIAIFQSDSPDAMVQSVHNEIRNTRKGTG